MKDFTAFRRHFDGGTAELLVPDNEHWLGVTIRAPGHFTEERTLDGGAFDLGVVMLQPSRFVEFEITFPKDIPAQRREFRLEGLNRFAVVSLVLLELPMEETRVLVSAPCCVDREVVVPSGVSLLSVALEAGHRVDVRVLGVVKQSYGNGYGTILAVSCDDTRDGWLPRFQVAKDGLERLTGLPEGKCLLSLSVAGAAPIATEVVLPIAAPVTLDGRRRAK